MRSFIVVDSSTISGKVDLWELNEKEEPLSLIGTYPTDTRAQAEAASVVGNNTLFNIRFTLGQIAPNKGSN